VLRRRLRRGWLGDFGRGRWRWRALSASRRSNASGRGWRIRASGPYSGRPQLAELLIEELILFVEPEKLLMKLLLALLEVCQLLLDGRTQLPEIFGGIIRKRGAGWRNKACCAEKQYRHRLKIAAAPSSPMCFCKLIRAHQSPPMRLTHQDEWHNAS
jgi:hypothetical protein